MTFDPKAGDIVRVCYDGKHGRCSEGKVLKRRGFAIQVEFLEWLEKEKPPVTCWFIRRTEYSFGGYLRVKDSLMKMAFGVPGDWYSVFDKGD
jgi:hypothetical protein